MGKLPRYVLLLVGVLLLVTTSACACTDLLRRIQGVQQGQAANGAATSTMAPTITRSPAKVATPRGAEEPGTFTLELTEADMREMLADQPFSHDAVTVTVEEVTLGDGQVRVQLQVSESEMGLNVGVTAVGEPYVEDGQAYVEIVSFSLDQSVTGFVRLLAQAAIQEAINQATGEQGIPVPVEGVEVLSMEVQPGVIVIRGRRP